MKKLAITVFLITTALSCGAQKALFSYFSYNGNDWRFEKQIDRTTEYFNPILAGFYPDPSVCRKGDTYYLVNSSFAFFPGVPIFESKDLVNWEQIGHVLDRESQLNLKNLGVSEGIYAPAISYNEKNDTFYMITTLIGNGGNFYVKTKDPRKGWSDPIWLPKVDGIDPSFLFDKDGKAYIVHNAPVRGEPEYEGQRAIRLLNFDVKKDCTFGEPIEIVRGGTHVTPNPIWIEGPHLYHIGDWYYLMCAEGGTGEGHSEVIFRAKKPEGPWEEAPGNPILTQRNLPDSRENIVTCTGHADIIQTPDNEWWAVFLGCRPYEGNMYNTGRDTYLLPVVWENGWPRILEDGKSVPAIVKKSGLKPTDNYLSGNFSYTDNFKGASLDKRWIFLRNAPENAYSLSDKGLELHATNGTTSDKSEMSAIFVRQQHPDFTVETEVDFAPSFPRQLAGLALVQNEQNNFVVGKTIMNGKPAIVLKRTEGKESIIGSAILNDDAPVKLKIEGNGRYYSFYYKPQSSDEWQTLAQGVDASNLSTSKSGGFIGTVVGPYVTKRNK